MRHRKQPPKPLQVSIKKVASANGRAWLTQAYKMFKQSVGVWLGIASFLTLLQLIPVVNQLASLFIPFAIGGLMLGCQKQVQGQAIKFDHVFEGIKQDSKQLIILSLSYGLMSLAVMLITFMLMQSLGLDISKILPEELQKMTPMQLTQWIETADPQVVLQLFQALLTGLAIALTLMVPILMALWFAPALVVFKKQPALKALKLSFDACRVNMMPLTFYGLAVIGYAIIFFLGLSFISLILPFLAIPAIIFAYLAVFSITVTSIYSSFADVFIDESMAPTTTEPPASDSSMIA